MAVHWAACMVEEEKRAVTEGAVTLAARTAGMAERCILQGTAGVRWVVAVKGTAMLVETARVAVQVREGARVAVATALATAAAEK
eukprot:231610-Prymnesium_polylepis.1